MEYVAANYRQQFSNDRLEADSTVIGSMRLPGNLTLHGVLGEGAYGQVWSATDAAGKYWALKRQVFAGDKVKVDEFKREIMYQNLFARYDLALPVQAAWVTPRNAAGVIQMDLIDGTLDDVIGRHEDNDAVMAWLANALRKLHAGVKKAGLVHGDMHFGNIAVHMSHDRREASLVLIDFGKSFSVTDTALSRVRLGIAKDVLDADAFWVWRASMRSRMNFFLRAVGFPGSSLMKSLSGSDRPSPEDVSETIIEYRGAVDLFSDEERVRRSRPMLREYATSI